MFYTYILESLKTPEKRYVGHTRNRKSRLTAHNTGDCPHTRRHRPWKAKIFIAFETIGQARRFETYLKTGSGRAFGDVSGGRLREWIVRDPIRFSRLVANQKPPGD